MSTQDDHDEDRPASRRLSFTLADLRRAMDLPSMLSYVAEKRAAAEYDRRVAAGIDFPECHTPSDKARFMANLSAEYQYRAPVYDLADITDDELTEFLDAGIRPSSSGWLRRITGDPIEPSQPMEQLTRVSPPPPPELPQVGYGATQLR